MKVAKTNAMRQLDAKKIDYQMLSYDHSDGKIDGVSVAMKIGKNPDAVFKTLAATGGPNELFVFVIPVARELDLKKAAKVAGAKKIEMLPVKDLLKWTGYIRGGCSPIGMKKLYPTFVDEQANEFDTMIVSAGKIGTQIEITIENLVKATDAKVVELTKKA